MLRLFLKRDIWMISHGVADAAGCSRGGYLPGQLAMVRLNVRLEPAFESMAG
jgi:hypothetical protein